MKRLTRNSLLIYLIAGPVLALATFLIAGEMKYSTTYWSTYNHFMSYSATNIVDLGNIFKMNQKMLPPYPPANQAFWLAIDPQYIPFNPKKFPKHFLKKLIGIEKDGYFTYPIIMRENPDTRCTDILNVDGNLIGSVPPPKDYDVLQYIIEHYGEPPADIQRDSEAFAVWIAERDPARFFMYGDLILEEELVKYATIQSDAVAQAELDALLQPKMMMIIPSSYGGVPSVTNLKFYAVNSVSNMMEMTIAYPYPPSFTNIDIFACTDLVEKAWSLICTTNIDLSTNHVCLIDTDVTNMQRRFYTTWNADYDGDLDGLNDGRETLLYGTSTTNSDSDYDTMPDGWEIAHSLNPLVDDGAGDPDSDNLVNTNEYLCGTYPDDADTDDDGWNDGWEVTNGFDSLDDTDPDGATDYDNDGLSTAEEAVLGTDPVLFDSDSDGLWDKWEIQTGFKPLTNDTDDILQTGETIQQMINAASPGDILVVPVGTYNGSGNRDIQYNGKSLTLISANGPENTTIDCEDASRGFTFDDSEDVTSILNGFTITGGSATNGGGIYCYGSSPIIRNCIITHNRAIEYGGGIYCVPETISTTDYIGSQPVIENCRIERNSAPCGGGIRSIDYEDFADFTSYTRTAPKLTNSIISWNSATKTGGGISCFRSQFILENSAVMHNMTDTNSPGIEVNYGEMTINSSVISGNTAPNAKNGAGVYAIHYYYNPAFGSEYIGETDIRNTIIHDNSPVTNQICEYEYYTWPQTSHCSVNYSAHNGNQTSWLDAYGYNRNVVTINAPTCVTTSDPGITSDGHLTASSTNLFNEGQTSTATPFDKDGESRGASVDIGLDEYIETESTPDSLPDWFEDEYFGSTNSAQTGTGDPDGDGLSNEQEYIAGTSPLHNDDKDLDGLSDDDEIYRGTDPENPDTDGDGLTDGYEVNTSNTDPKYWDSDGDEMSDGWEDEYNLDPNDATGSNGATGNTDGDNWNNKKEYDQGSNPGSSDTDGDGQPDHNDADPTNADDNRAAAGNTTDITMTIGDSSGSHSERYHMVILGSRYELYMPQEGVVVDKTITVPKGKTMHGYIESDYDNDEDGDYDAEVTGADVTVRSPEDTETLGGHHENSGFNYDRRYFTLDVGGLGVDLVGDYDYNGGISSADETASSERPLLLDAGSTNRVMARITGFPDTQESGYIRLQATKTGAGEIKVYDAQTGGNLLIDLTSGSPGQTSWTLSSGAPITDERYVYLEGVTASSAYGDIVLRTWWDDGSSQESPKDKLLVNVMSLGLVPDWNHDRQIDSEDEDQATPSNPFRFWRNDDSDSGDIAVEDSDLPIDIHSFWHTMANCEWGQVKGRCDLLDYFPVWLDISDSLSFLSSGTVEYKLRNDDEDLRFIYTDLAKTNAGDFLTTDSSAYGPSFSQNSYEADKIKITTDGVVLNQAFLSKIIANENKGVLLIEGADETTEPLVLEIWVDGEKLFEKELDISISTVEKMYRHLNLRSDGEGHETSTSTPINYPDTLCSSKNLFFLHGFNVDGKQARAWNAELFKRLYWSGSNAKFWGVSWQGDDGSGINYQANVANAFHTASNLAAQVSVVSDKVMLAHSLGNMVVSAAIQDYGLNVDCYFMLNAAVATECYRPASFSDATNNNYMVHEDWLGYSNKTWCSKWHELFSSPDDRTKLTWKGRFTNVLSVAYNFYSEGDELFEIKPYPLYSFSGSIWNLERYAWQKQEVFKGCFGLGSTDWAGWGFSGEYNMAEANTASPDNLRTNAVFRHDPSTMFSSNIATNVVNDILAQGVPALSHAAGFNAINILGLYNYNADGTKPANYPNRGDPYFSRWLHSDLKNVAYPYTHQFFEEIITEGGLK